MTDNSFDWRVRRANWALLALSEELEVVIVFPFHPNMISILHRSLTDRQLNREPVKEFSHIWAHAVHVMVCQARSLLLFYFIFTHLLHVRVMQQFAHQGLCYVNQLVKWCPLEAGCEAG